MRGLEAEAADLTRGGRAAPLHDGRGHTLVSHQSAHTKSIVGRRAVDTRGYANPVARGTCHRQSIGQLPNGWLQRAVRRHGPAMRINLRIHTLSYARSC